MTITEELIDSFCTHLCTEERSTATVYKYVREVAAFALWLNNEELSKEAATAWKHELVQHGYHPATVNTALAALNGLFRFLGRDDCRVRFLKIQRRAFRDESKELTQGEYNALVEAARARGKTRLALLIETIGGTGVRVSEVAYITVEAAQRGRAEIALKGKIRTILLPAKLCRKLLKYAKAQHIDHGAIFRTATGKPLSRRQIWGEMKAICRAAGVEPSKVFPHNLRHLFAVAFYKVSRDIVKLADVLGHSSIETTRIYLMTTEKEHQRQLDRLRLVS